MAKAHADSQELTERRTHMGLKAPGLLTFLISFVVMMAVIFAKFFGAHVPGLNENTEFTGMLLAYLILASGCLLRVL